MEHLVLIGLEQEVNTAPYASNLILIVQENILAVEVLSSCYDILCKSVVSTDFPTLQRSYTIKATYMVISCSESCIWRQGTICYRSTPGTLVGCISTLIAYLYIVGILVAVIINLPVSCTGIVEGSLYILVEGISNTGVSNLECILVDTRQGMSAQANPVVSDTGFPLAVSIVYLTGKIGCSLIILTC